MSRPAGSAARRSAASTTIGARSRFRRAEARGLQRKRAALRAALFFSHKQSGCLSREHRRRLLPRGQRRDAAEPRLKIRITAEWKLALLAIEERRCDREVGDRDAVADEVSLLRYVRVEYGGFLVEGL